MSTPDFLAGGGEMGALMRAHDWSTSSLGQPARWPQSLRTVVRLMLNTGHPMYVWWGADCACLYNDAYRESIGPERHPGSLGRPARGVWDEIWDIIGPQIDQVMSGGGATWHINHLVPITRYGRRDDAYWTYSYSPIDDEASPGGIGGVLVLCTETTQQVLAERRFRDLAEQLSDTNRLKDEFLATLAHELRNPLAPIRNALESMKLAPDDRRVGESARELMERQLAQMVRLIDDLMDLSRVSRGIVELRRSRLSLAAALRDAVETSRPTIEHFGDELVVSLPDEDLVIHGDPTRIVQVFANLLNNAAKFTPRGGHITLTLARIDAGTAAVSVRDDGVGIPTDLLDRVFDMFAQLDRSHTQLGGGLGIGLTLVRRLVEMHGGTVAARSAGPGTGSEFVVRLPLAAPAAAEAETAVPDDPRSAPAALGRRIVVADDNVDAVESLAMMLELLGHETRIAHDGAEALALAHDFRPEVMVLDIAMPGLDGHDLARRIRAEPWGRGVLLIAASGWGQAEDKEESRAAGFDHHLVKPLQPEALDALLRAE
jgi:signal transduction histidine kinase/CheY-like chemotaxis protein